MSFFQTPEKKPPASTASDALQSPGKYPRKETRRTELHPPVTAVAVHTADRSSATPSTVSAVAAASSSKPASKATSSGAGKADVNTIDVPQGVMISLIDMGQGCAALIRGPNGFTVLVDCGTTTRSAIANTLVTSARAYLLAHLACKESLFTLDCLVISHPDSDHINRVGEVLDGVHVKQILIGGKPEAISKKTKFVKFLRAANEINKGGEMNDAALVDACLIDKGKQYVEWPGGEKQLIKTGTEGFDIYIVAANTADTTPDQLETVLGKNHTTPGTLANCHSAVLCLRYATKGEGKGKGKSEPKVMQAMICADATYSTEVFMLQHPYWSKENNLNAYFLTGGHHGSQDSFSQKFLAAVDPSLIYFAADAKETYGHPTTTAVKRIVVSCPKVIANTSVGPHAIMLGIPEGKRKEDTPAMSSADSIETPQELRDLLEGLRKALDLKAPGSATASSSPADHASKPSGSTASAASKAAVATAIDESDGSDETDESDAQNLTPLKIEEAWIREAEKALREFLKKDVRRRTWIKEIETTLNNKAGHGNLPPLSYFARDICRILQCEQQDIGISPGKRYWDRSVIDYGIIMTLFGQNLGVYWELMLPNDGGDPILTNC